MWARGSAAASASAGAGSLPVAGFGRGRGAPAPAAKAGGAAAGWSARDVARLGVFLALATALHIFEAQLPALPIAGAKIGLANLVSMFALYAWGFREALLIVVMRQLVGSLVTGTLFAPAFVFGLTGGGVSVAVMALVLRLAGALGPVAVAEVGDQDLWNRATVGVACVSNEGAHAHQVLGQVLRFVESVGEVEIDGVEVRLA